MTQRKLYKNPQHPLATLISKTHSFFDSETHAFSDIRVPGEKFKLFTDFDPAVTPHDCFDQLFIPKDHVSRKPTDTYYFNRDLCLRTHTSAH